ncbi:exocyst complex component exo70 [Malassezia cuniculi]|uniref:Exocyst complex component exo70 n=1 Tax=Malassezia cuniculi TaxID=948313 RepID=A0AAF0EYM4_9BASI|nr:exocyst complex component exo70 [Malassezia cuniculi]
MPAMTELELLSQNQNRLASLTGRMTTILNGFDRRLVKLESSILPIHQSTQTLSRISTNVELTQQELGRSLRHYGVVVEEEPLIMQGPNLRDPKGYMDAIMRVVHNMQNMSARSPGNAERVTSKMSALIELGGFNLATIVREYTLAESRTINGVDYIAQRAWPGMSATSLENIRNLLLFLQALPATQSKTPFAAALEAFVNVRGAYLKSSVWPAMKRTADVVNKAQSGSVTGVREGLIDYKRGAAHFGEWFTAMYGMVQTEQQVLAALVRGTSIESSFEDIWTSILHPLVSAVSTLVSSLLPRLHHGLNAHRMVVLDFISASTAVLGKDGHNWTTLLQRGEAPNKDLADAMVNSQRDALLFFPEFIRDVKIIPVQRDSSAINSGVNDVSVLCVRLIHELSGYADVVYPLLETLGKKNWKSSGVQYGSQSDSVGQRLYDEYVVDLLASVVVSLERTISAITQRTVSAIFILNNIVYLQAQLVTARAVPPNALPACDQQLAQALRTARTSYLETWQHVVNSLVEEPGLTRSNTISKLSSLGGGGGSSSSSDKSRDPARCVYAYRNFNDYLAQMQAIHAKHPLRPEGRLNETLRDDVTRLVCPLYSVYLAKQRPEKSAYTC